MAVRTFLNLLKATWDEWNADKAPRLGALGVFGALQDALNTIWEVAPKPGLSLVEQIKLRFMPLTLVLGTGFLLLVSLVVSAVLTGIGAYFGSLLTSLLFVIGKLLIGLYLGNASVGSIYGTAGSLAVLLVWIYYSAQILFLGAEFTQVYANQYGSRIRPNAHAVALTERMRAQ